MIYFIRSPSGPIKIGTTIRLSQRLKQLAAEYGEGLEVLAVTEGDRNVEQELHRRFGHLRLEGSIQARMCRRLMPEQGPDQ